MSELEEKLGAVLNNPQLMGQILSMAQNLGAGQPPPKEAPAAPQEAPAGPDPAMLQALAGMARRSGVDQNQQALLKALGPYLSPQRVRKLEKAMRAAKLARMASGFLNAGGPSPLSGR